VFGEHFALKSTLTKLDVSPVTTEPFPSVERLQMVAALATIGDINPPKETTNAPPSMSASTVFLLFMKTLLIK
jgi:hypothetical protein